jgi:hypothetical protein
MKKAVRLISACNQSQRVFLYTAVMQFTLKPDVPNKKFTLMAYAVISEENFILLNLYEIEYFTY